MSEDLYEIIEEEIKIITPTVKMNEAHTIMHKLHTGNISRGEAVSKIYLEGREKPEKRGKYKKEFSEKNLESVLSGQL